jgi:hypothetical protein
MTHQDHSFRDRVSGTTYAQDAYFHQQMRMDSGTAQAIARKVTEGLPHLVAQGQSRKAYGGVPPQPRPQVKPRQHEGAEARQSSREIRHDLLRKLHAQSNAGMVKIKDVSQAIEELLA